MPEIPILFYAGLLITAVAIAVLIYAAIIRPGIDQDDPDKPWWIEFLEWVYQHLGPVGVVGVLLLVVGLFVTAWGWSPTMVADFIATLAKVFGNAESSTQPSPI